MMAFGVSEEELRVAREIASKVLHVYGDFDDADWHQFITNGIWNDHASVQSAIETIKYMKNCRV
jgi:hypothetical protein